MKQRQTSLESRTNKNTDNPKREEERTRTSWHGQEQAKTKGHGRAEERKLARKDSEAEKAKPQPKWWRKRRLNKTKWRKDDVMDAGAVEMALADGEDPSGRPAVVNMAEAQELGKQAALHSTQNLFWLVLDDQVELEFNDESIFSKDQTV